MKFLALVFCLFPVFCFGSQEVLIGIERTGPCIRNHQYVIRAKKAERGALSPLFRISDISVVRVSCLNRSEAPVELASAEQGTWDIKTEVWTLIRASENGRQNENQDLEFDFSHGRLSRISFFSTRSSDL